MCRVYPLDTPGARLPNPPDMAWLALLDPGLYRRLRLIRQRRPDDDITLDVAAGSVAAQLDRPDGAGQRRGDRRADP